MRVWQVLTGHFYDSTNQGRRANTRSSNNEGMKKESRDQGWCSFSQVKMILPLPLCDVCDHTVSQ